jgi:hypothetical protein
MTPVAIELQQLANDIKSRRQATRQLRRRAMAIEPVTLPARALHGSYGRTTCSLCGDPSDQQVCAGCAVYMGEHGL